MNLIEIKTPFDRHGHLREKETLMQFVLPHSAQQFWGMVVMPNLSKPVTTWQMAQQYRQDIVSIGKANKLPLFKPVMTAYLTDNTDPKNIREGFQNGTWQAAKLYPHGATTNSDHGVTMLQNIFPILAEMEKLRMPLLVHPETSADRHIIPFTDRERVYTQESLVLIHETFPELIMSIEHVTTKEAVQFVESAPEHVVATVTPQHLMYTTDAIFHGGVPPFKPGFYAENMCLPILKPEDDRSYLRHAITKGEQRRKFGAGTDTAPHTQADKQSVCSRCGCFNATHAVEFYAQVFDEQGMFNVSSGLSVFEAFMSVNNLWIYGITPSSELITIEQKDQTIPELVSGNLRPFKAGQTIPWKMVLRK